jgi:hypothetical protein
MPYAMPAELSIRISKRAERGNLPRVRLSLMQSATEEAQHAGQCQAVLSAERQMESDTESKRQKKKMYVM